MKLNIRKKISFSFLLVIALMLSVVVISNYGMRSLHNQYSHLLEVESKDLEKTRLIQVSSTRLESQFYSYLLSKEADDVKAMQSEQGIILKRIQSIKENETNKKSKEYLGQIEGLVQAHEKRLTQAIKQNEIETSIQENILAISREIRTIADQLALEKQREIDEVVASSSADIEKKLRWSLLMSAGAIILSVAVGIILSIVLSRPIKLISAQAEEISKGNLAISDLQIRTKDETSILAHSFNTMKANLRELIHQIQAGAGQVSKTASELASGSEENTAATQQVSEHIQCTSQDMQEQLSHIHMSKMQLQEAAQDIEGIAINVQDVSVSAGYAAELSMQGQNVIQAVIKQMAVIQSTIDAVAENVESLNKRSTDINSITEAIKWIADQTNLLSLNAAIEAARAGEHGRGFAVVADEVRKLAVQSAKSAQDITALVKLVQEEANQAFQAAQQGMSEVNQGLEAVQTAGKQFTNIHESFTNVDDKIAGIREAIQQVSTQSKEIVQVFEQMSSKTDEMAMRLQTVAETAKEQSAASEEIAASAEEMTAMAEGLHKGIAKFKV
ncbi:methyl-accepting chemotaxis protein [Ectobacillus antri]|uniref:Methyl-accepting chemotaxis protein n=1 Tax=Ectobacillus antri TaxID=2486280 RepID=A0ABT6H650_9BACI|nr:methyl-accepting chemotaxis protein [Ectobacillus antri]MDG4656790.1 methyl-accepting chemotaxis protein [Ectobacillus antri]MDG5754313.1 methyl-accepting chemotaxis protein [Ectobacillus antri]